MIDHWTVISFEGEIFTGEIILLLATSLKLSVFTGICLIFIFHRGILREVYLHVYACVMIFMLYS